VITVGVTGYGTIGKRVADAVARQDDMTVGGVAKRRPSHEARTANRRGFPLYVADPDRRDAFETAGFSVAGTFEEMLETVDVVVDATPSGVGAANKPTYEAHGVPAIYQGGEDPEVAPVSFTARANYEEAVDADAVRVVSCNTTGLARLLAPLDAAFGVSGARVTLVRRGGDPDQSDRGPIDDVLPDPVTTPSHHGPDVERVLPGMDVHTMSLKVPTTLMHVHSIEISLETTPTRAAILDRLASEPRLALVDGDLAVESCADLRECARDAGRPRGDLWENCIWAESITVEDSTLRLYQAIHQEADVVPENVDAIRAVTGATDGISSRMRTNTSLPLSAVDHDDYLEIATL